MSVVGAKEDTKFVVIYCDLLSFRLRGLTRPDPSFFLNGKGLLLAL